MAEVVTSAATQRIQSQAAASALLRLLAMLSSLLPEGRPLPDDVWRRRHRGIVILLALHIPWLLWYGLMSVGQPLHLFGEMSALAAAVVLASWPRLGRELRMMMASFGLVTCSALLVHFSGGVIEMHFHYFVMVAVVSLYQRWTPYLLTIVYVALQHGTIGIIDPRSVYDHQDAWLHPWKWAGIHAAFVLAASCVGLISWRLNEALRYRTELILESVGEGICGLDAQGKITFINPIGAALIGYQPNDLVGRGWQELTQGVTSAAAGSEVVMIPLAGQPRSVTGALRAKSGATIPVECVSNAIREHDAGAGVTVLTFKDISERLEAERAIQTLNAELEQRVAERTGQFDVANRQLNAANRELEAFSSSVAHDLRAPLRTIDGFSEVLLQRYSEGLDERAKDYLGRVRMASQRMAELIDDLLNLSRVTRTELVRNDVDLTGAAEQVVAELRASAPDRTCEVSIQPGLHAHADSQLMRVVLVNLLGNAWKFTAKQAKPIIELGAAETRRGKVTFFVRDNGAGFDMAYADKLFGAFQRLHSEEEFEGTGIGLATAARIVQRHGGEIWPEGCVNLGATFYFTLGDR